MYGREHGLLVAVARGASSPRSKQAGHLEPFSEAEVMIAKGIAFDKLAVASKVASQKSKVKSLAFLVIAGAFSDLVIQLTRQGIADERIFFLIREAVDMLASLPESPSPERARLLHAAATLRLLDLIGFAPPINAAAPGTTPVPHLAVASFLRRAPLADVVRLTAPRDVLANASAFVEDALRETPLEIAPHGVKTIQAILG